MNRSFVSAWVFYQSPLYCICIIVVVRVKKRGPFQEKPLKRKYLGTYFEKFLISRLETEGCVVVTPAWLLSDYYHILVWSDLSPDDDSHSVSLACLSAWPPAPQARTWPSPWGPRCWCRSSGRRPGPPWRCRGCDRAQLSSQLSQLLSWAPVLLGTLCCPRSPCWPVAPWHMAQCRL